MFYVGDLDSLSFMCKIYCVLLGCISWIQIFLSPSHFSNLWICSSQALWWICPRSGPVLRYRIDPLFLWACSRGCNVATSLYVSIFHDILSCKLISACLDCRIIGIWVPDLFCESLMLGFWARWLLECLQLGLLLLHLWMRWRRCCFFFGGPRDWFSYGFKHPPSYRFLINLAVSSVGVCEAQDRCTVIAFIKDTNV